VDRTASIYLPSSRKLVFMRHRQFLERKHKYHKMKRHFDNAIEKDSAPKWYTGKLLFEMVKNIQVVFEKGTIKGQKRKKKFLFGSPPTARARAPRDESVAAGAGAVGFGCDALRKEGRKRLSLTPELTLAGSRDHRLLQRIC
jgi:hypothetical protein